MKPGGCNAIEAQCRTPPPVCFGTAPFRERSFPIEPIEHRGKPTLMWKICHVLHQQDGILQVGRHHTQVLRIQGQQLQVFHD